MKFEYTSDELKGSKRVPDIQNYGNAVSSQNSNAIATSHSVQRIVIIAIGLIFLIGGICWWLSQSGSVAQNGGRDSSSSIPVSEEFVEVSPQMAGKKIGLCVGLNEVDPDSYSGCSVPPLNGCCNDADRFSVLLRSAQYSVKVLKDSDATVANVGRLLNEAADELSAGDMFAMLVSGHGNRVQQSDGRKQECWCLYDGCVWNEHIIKAFSRFRKGVRILLVNDQCFSGGMFIDKKMSVEAHRRYWETKSKDASWSADKAIKGPDFPQLIQFASSRAEQESKDMGIGGQWTLALLMAFNERPSASLHEWFNLAFAKVPRGRQEPQWVEFGPVTQDFRDMSLLRD